MLASQIDTIDLVKRAQAGDAESFAILFQNHQREVCGYLIGLLETVKMLTILPSRCLSKRG